MPLFSHDSDEKASYENYQEKKDSDEHKGHLSYDVIAGAAAYEAAKKFQEHSAQNGKPSSHAQAKEIAAGAIAAFLTHEVSTKGLDWFDEHKKKKLQEEAQAKVEAQLSSEYN